MLGDPLLPSKISFSGEWSGVCLALVDTTVHTVHSLLWARNLSEARFESQLHLRCLKSDWNVRRTPGHAGHPVRYEEI